MQTKIPYLPTLDELDLSSIALPMEGRAARNFINTVNWPRYPYRPITVLDIARGKRDIYLYFFVREKYAYTRFSNSKDGENIEEDSCVAFFCQTGENSYIKFIFNCRGICYALRCSPHEETPLFPDEYTEIRRYIPSRKNQEKKEINCWELSVAIPLKLIGFNPQKLPEKIKINFFKWGTTFENRYYLTWNPVQLGEPKFDCLEFFGELTFEKEHTK